MTLRYLPLAFCLILFSLHGVDALAIEEPQFEVLKTTEDYEIRRYEPYIVAEVDVAGSMGDSSNEAFRILAGYIFGGNQGRKKMEMTAPVESRAAAEGTRMEMTAPVLSAETGADDELLTYSFVMESQYNLGTLPVPNDPRIRIRELPARVMAARRYSGRWTESNYRNNEQQLLDALDAAEIPVTGSAISARYNAPFVPAFLRRNEILVAIDPQAVNAEALR